MSIHITLPYPPSSNRYWRNFRGRMVLSAEAVKYRATVRNMALQAGIQTIEGLVAMQLLVYRPRKAGDLSNRIKVLEDALQGVAYANDSQVVEIHARRYDDKTNPRVDVTVEAA